MRPASSRLLRALVVLGCVLGMTGCASLPDSSAPQALGTLDRQPTSAEPAPPISGREPDQLLRDFLQATADPTNRHQAARQFLSPSANVNWDDSAGTTIVDRPDTLRESRTADTATYVIRARKIGELSPDGAYRASDGTLENKVELVKVDGEWRVDALPSGVIVEQTAFAKSYKRYSLFFPNLAGQAMVPDLRWVSVRKDQLPQRLLGLLAEGSQTALEPAVRNPLSTPVTLRGPITKANGETENVGVGAGGVQVDFSGAAALDQKAKDLLATQVVLTLAGADVIGPYVLLADGKPLDERYAAGWQLSDVEDMGPNAVARNRAGLHAVRDGSLISVGENGIAPAPGFFGTTHTLQSVAVSPDAQLVAAVANSGRPEPEPGRTLIIGTYDGQGFPVDAAGSFTRPSWPADGSSAWTVVDGEKVKRAVHDRATGNVSLQDVDITELMAAQANSNGSVPRGPITELRISPSGARAALVAGGKVYLAVVTPQPGGRFALTSPLPLAVGLTTPVVSVDWQTDEKVVLVREGNIDPVATVLVDGSGFQAQTTQNLTPPVRVVSAVPDHEYVADSRAVLELTRNPEGGEYWREVPGLGANAVPVLPG
ncbi:MtrAB system accessory lipoprotein LpqB [Nocardia huaxiensis]|uniref:Lipoprotein LpqB n=1 Tax=Nocardia huaxiensis TaxID=2755382 RepID=A0A7D6ZJY5_9NOCA|nr:MtrAB system accessory lipoprotein LpqB [Nocardia huaxiensis]QLY32919.1 MtrAB system accessory protein LpqB [Nocardia huaxiensis]UFS93320.1 MtrAB system accessory lipoprotein LpqB [Nocardia huaxiensis]